MKKKTKLIGNKKPPKSRIKEVITQYGKVKYLVKKKRKKRQPKKTWQEIWQQYTTCNDSYELKLRKKMFSEDAKTWKRSEKYRIRYTPMVLGVDFSKYESYGAYSIVSKIDYGYKIIEHFYSLKKCVKALEKIIEREIVCEDSSLEV
jgi:hypothetical protein